MPDRSSQSTVGPGHSSTSGVASGSPAQKALRKLGLLRPIDLALHLPMRYEDETRITRLAEARSGGELQIEGEVTASDIVYRPKRQWLLTVREGDETCVMRFFNFYTSQIKAMPVGTRVRARGELRGGFAGWTMLHPVLRLASTPLPTALTPIYPSTAQLPQAYLHKAIHGALNQVLPQLHDTLAPITQGPEGCKLWPLPDALSFLHHPAPEVALAQLQDRSHPAWTRLKAEELLAQQLSQLQSKRARAALKAPALHWGEQGLAQRLRERLPFALTPAQRRALAEIEADLRRAAPMHRLLQGDVGSGKTVVAALAALAAVDAGWQCALMAPTEILARQHFAKLVEWLAPLGVEVAWLTGAQKKKERVAMLAAIASGQAAVVVGTHAVIAAQVQFAKLALAIIDEQHRFGVEQRLALRSKMQGQESDRCLEPHLLMMSATPIPRTLAMSYYADLDVSVIDELPPGRTPIVTKLIATERRGQVLERMAQQLQQGRQVYWVCPLIEESEALDLRDATQTQEELQAALPQVVVGLLHSRMKPQEKAAVMQAFIAGQMGVLVSTTVIEVGVDVPNASLMVIDHAERFGLSQLHQLRGRVGRGAAASACVLLYAQEAGAGLGQHARQRLRAMVQTHDGFEIARRDLEIRGPGEFLGARQSGTPLLRFADLSVDTPILEWAKAVAPYLLDQHPELAEQHMARWLGGKSEYLKV